jgi:hypothetical protein
MAGSPSGVKAAMTVIAATVCHAGLFRSQGLIPKIEKKIIFESMT